jgi:hypothetical protein
LAETKAEKAHRYLCEHRVTLERVDDLAHRPGRVVATVRGDTGTYACGYDPARAPHWRCTCEAWKLTASHPDCSHLIAVKLVVERPA